MNMKIRNEAVSFLGYLFQIFCTVSLQCELKFYQQPLIVFLYFPDLASDQMFSKGLKSKFLKLIKY
jgi:hypothetical protein